MFYAFNPPLALVAEELRIVHTHTHTASNQSADQQIKLVCWLSHTKKACSQVRNYVPIVHRFTRHRFNFACPCCCTLQFDVTTWNVHETDRYTEQSTQSLPFSAVPESTERIQSATKRPLQTPTPPLDSISTARTNMRSRCRWTFLASHNRAKYHTSPHSIE